MLAHEYGWSKKDILENVYYDELFYLIHKINNRKLGEYRMQLAIAQNPHVKDPKQLWRILEQQEQKPRSEKFDPQGFEVLKARLRQNPRFNVK